MVAVAHGDKEKTILDHTYEEIRQVAQSLRYERIGEAVVTSVTLQPA